MKSDYIPKTENRSTSRRKLRHSSLTFYLRDRSISPPITLFCYIVSSLLFVLPKDSSLACCFPLLIQHSEVACNLLLYVFHQVEHLHFMPPQSDEAMLEVKRQNVEQKESKQGTYQYFRHKLFQNAIIIRIISLFFFKLMRSSIY